MVGGTCVSMYMLKVLKCWYVSCRIGGWPDYLNLLQSLMCETVIVFGEVLSLLGELLEVYVIYVISFLDVGIGMPVGLGIISRTT